MPTFDWISRSRGERLGVALAYDTWRDRTVLFAGANANLGWTDGTWEWDGTDWELRSVGTGPTPRISATLAFDARRGETLLFGGGNGTVLDDMWAWNGTAWRQLQPSVRPSARGGHAMCFQDLRDRVLLFGGVSGSALLGDTWEWDGTNWQQLAPATAPSPRRSTAMTYDVLRQRAVLFGGNLGTSGSTAADDTWEWDGVSWQRSVPTVRPPAVFAKPMVYDLLRQVSVLVADADLWDWNGAAWTRRPTTGAPGSGTAPFGSAPGAVFHLGRQCVTLIGYNAASTGTWECSGSQWSDRSDDTTLVGSWTMTATIDPTRDQPLLFASGSTPSEHRTMVWRDRQWRRLRPTQEPLARTAASFATDPVRRRAMLFGGFVANGSNDETWEWDGIHWTLANPPSRPIARSGAALAFDPVTQRMLLFGGIGNLSAALGDTWAWDGLQWTALQPAHAPPPRAYAAMATDPTRARIALFGGRSVLPLGDTWEWDGRDWSAMNPTNAPSARIQHAMTWSDELRAVTLTGGAWVVGLAPPGTWAWDGVDWRRLPTANEPQARTGHAMVRDPASRQLLVVGGFADARTWQLGDLVPAMASDVGRGCTGAFGVPRLGGGVPLLGDAAFAIELAAAARNTPALALFAPTLGTTRLWNGCDLLLHDPMVGAAAITDVFGNARWPLPIPARRELLGEVLQWQAAAIDPTAAGGFVLTAARRVQFGD